MKINLHIANISKYIFNILCSELNINEIPIDLKSELMNKIKNNTKPEYVIIAHWFLSYFVYFIFKFTGITENFCNKLIVLLSIT